MIGSIHLGLNFMRECIGLNEEEEEQDHYLLGTTVY